MHHAIVFNYIHSDTQASDICHNSKIFDYKTQLQRIHRKGIHLHMFRWTKYAILLLKICQITSINAKQAENSVKI